MARDFLWYLLRGLVVVLLVYLLGGARCTSGDIRKEVIEQQVENQGAKDTAAKYIPEGPDRERVFSALDNSSKLMVRQDQKLTQQTERADKNQSAADALFWLKWAGRLAVVAAVVGGLWLKFKP